MSVGGQPQTQLVGRDRKLTNEKRVLGALTNQRTVFTWAAFLTLASSRSASLGGGEVKVCSVFMLTLSFTSSRSMFFLPECWEYTLESSRTLVTYLPINHHENVKTTNYKSPTLNFIF